MNWIAWSSFLGQCLLAYLAIEGVKAILDAFRDLARSWWRVGLNLAAGALVGWTIVPGSGLWPWQGRGWYVVMVVVSALVTAGLHRLVKRLRPTEPHHRSK